MSIIDSVHLGEVASETFLPSLPVSCAVLCVDCERITVSYNDGCPVCGGRSLLNVAQILGGTLSVDRARRIEQHSESPLDSHHVAKCA
ncbi:MAG TPA: hypothetical protein VGR96_05450 [Acidobacteriaceae bacterium]|nr:hypothetical protein [Acidobacteriaceae bacterium]